MGNLKQITEFVSALRAKGVVLSIVLLAIGSFSTPVNSIPSSVFDFTELLLQQNYSDAELYIDTASLSKDDSLFLEVLYHSAYLADYESYAIDGRDFLILCDSARTSFRAEEEHNRETKLFYYLGIMEGAVAVTRGKRNDYAGALTASNISKDCLGKFLKKEAAFPEADFGLALRNFYSASIFNKIGLASKKLETSIERLEKATASESVTSYSQMPSLFWVYFDRGMFDEAEALGNRFIAKYPDNSMMLRAMLKLYTTREEYDVASRKASHLMLMSSERSPTNWSDYFSAGRAVVTSLIGEEKIGKAKNEIDTLLAISLDSDTMKLEWVKKHRTWLEQERVRLEKML